MVNISFSSRQDGLLHYGFLFDGRFCLIYLIIHNFIIHFPCIYLQRFRQLLIELNSSDANVALFDVEIIKIPYVCMKASSIHRCLLK